MPKEGVSIQVIRRLPRYYRYLSELEAQGVEKISSTKLATVMSSTASQIRQDLNCFGGFGQQGYGYSVAGLREEIGKILGLDRPHNTILIGAGNLGRAIARAILTRAPVILLDEATSALDEATEIQLLHNLRELQNKTCIIISHKKAAEEICDKTVTIADKKIRIN